MNSSKKKGQMIATEKTHVAGGALTRRLVQRDDGSILISWLAMLGWTARVEADGDVFAGVARHITADGEELRVSAVATARVDTIWQLFEGVVTTVGSTDADRELLSRRPKRQLTTAA